MPAIRSANGSDENNDGKFDTLLVETRGLKGPRTFDGSGIPLHKDNETVVKEKIYLDKADPEPAARRDHHHRPRADPSVDRDAHLSRATARRPGSSMSAPRTTTRSTLGEQNYLVSDDGYLSADPQGPAGAGSALFQAKPLVPTPDDRLGGEVIIGRPYS